MLTGRDVDAQEAERIGLVSSVVAEDALLDACYSMADRIGGVLPAGYRVDQAHTLEWTGRR